jgi:hypothetical protein
MGAVTELDPLLAKRRRIQRLAQIGQRVGYALYGIAVVGFFVALITGFSSAWVTIIITSMGIGSVFLAPAIVASYAVKAADREDRELGR